MPENERKKNFAYEGSDELNDSEKESPFKENPDLYNKKIVPVLPKERNIGVDVNNEFFENILEAAQVSKLDLAEIESFSQISQNRNLVYNVIDTMCEDSTIAAAVETYTEDSTERNENGKIVWAESSDSEVLNYITYLLDSLNIDKYIYSWMYSLVKYGDCYLRLYREADYDLPLFINKLKNKKQDLQEAVNVKIYKKSDKFAHYIEMVPNPAEMFELTRHGKTYAYISAPAAVMNNNKQDVLFNNSYRYFFSNRDVTVFDATEFVHAALLDTTSRVPEEVNLFIEDKAKFNEDGSINEVETDSVGFTVNRGLSLLYNTFKTWRNLTLLENSLLLNRLSKSALVRIMNVEVGDMPKENVGQHLLRIKQLIEQKTAFNQGNSMSEYTNPGPMENTVFVPTHNGIGTLSVQDVGGEVNPGSLSDIDYYRMKLCGSLKIPAQYLGWTDDNTGFNGGTSLSLTSSRYAKTIIRLQNTMIQAITDAINILLIDKGLDRYINKFELHMLRPTTQEDRDREDNKSTEIGIIRDIIDLLGEVPDSSIRLKTLQILLPSVVHDSDIINLLTDEIKKLEDEENGITNEDTGGGDDDFDDIDMDINFHEPSGAADFDTNEPADTGNEEQFDVGGEDLGGGEEAVSELPSPNELGIDMTEVQ